jgi:SAM-dependent methyltransferase
MTATGKPSPWVLDVIGRLDDVALDLPVMDLACGAGRHVRLLLERGHRILAVDRDISGLADLVPNNSLETSQFDLEDGSPWPFALGGFKAVLVTNYLHRPTLDSALALIGVGGVLIYETFAIGNERFGRPSNPDFLARPGEIAGHAKAAGFTIEIDETLEITVPHPAVVQRVLAAKPDD